MRAPASRGGKQQCKSHNDEMSGGRGCWGGLTSGFPETLQTAHTLVSAGLLRRSLDTALEATAG